MKSNGSSGRTQMRSWTDAHWVVVSSAATGVQLQHDRLAWPLLAREGRRILVGGDGDLFDEHVPLEFVASVFGVMALARQHTFQVLTRHPQRLELFLAWLDRHCGWLPMRSCEASLCKAALEKHGIDASRFATAAQTTWPLSNVWLGLSASAPDLPAKLPRLIHASAALRWLYVDRQTTHIDLTRFEGRRDELSRDGERLSSGNGVRMSLNALSGCIRHRGGAMVTTVGRLGWVVADARQNAALARCLAEQCARAKVPIYCFGDRQGLLPRQMPKRLEQAPHVDRRTAAAHPAVTATPSSAGRWLSIPATA